MLIHNLFLKIKTKDIYSRVKKNQQTTPLPNKNPKTSKQTKSKQQKNTTPTSSSDFWPVSKIH